MKHLLFLSVVVILLSGCSSLESIHSGALNVMQTEFPDDKVSYKRISSDEINYRSILGMNTYALYNKTETVNIFNFNGETIQTGTSGSFGAQLSSFLANASAITFLSVDVLGNDGLVSVLIGVLAGGVINNFLWGGHHYKNAIGISNKVMIDTDPKIDFYVNPSYIIRTQSGMFGSNYSVTANSIGVKLHDDLFVNGISTVTSKDVKLDNVTVTPIGSVENPAQNLGNNQVSQETKDNIEPKIAGCTDESACNYDIVATSDDGSCLALDKCDICGGDNSSCAGCDGVAYSGKVLDDCGICGGSGIPKGACDCDGNQNDALGVCGGLCEADDDHDGICDEFQGLGPLNFTIKDKLIYTDAKGIEYPANVVFFDEDGCYKVQYKNKKNRFKSYFVCKKNYDNLRMSE